jgi:hypothetical protein
MLSTRDTILVLIDSWKSINEKPVGISSDPRRQPVVVWLLKKLCHIPCRRWKSEDGIVSSLRERLARNRSLIPGRGRQFITFPELPDWLWGPTSFLFIGYRGFSPQDVKRPGRKADGSFPSSVEVKNKRSYTTTPWYIFMGYTGRQDSTLLLLRVLCVSVVAPSGINNE